MRTSFAILIVAALFTSCLTACEPAQEVDADGALKAEPFDALAQCVSAFPCPAPSTMAVVGAGEGTGGSAQGCWCTCNTSAQENPGQGVWADLQVTPEEVSEWPAAYARYCLGR